MTTLEFFVEPRRMRVTRDGYNRRVIVGRGLSLIAEHGNGKLSVLLMGTGRRWWNRRRDALIAAGCELQQDGDCEGSLSFDPMNDAACSAAIQAAGIKRRRTPSAAQLEVLAMARTRSPVGRAQSHVNGAKTDDRRAEIVQGLEPSEAAV